MSNKLNRVRVGNLFDSLERSLDYVERLKKSDDAYLQSVAERIGSQIEDWTMELGMMLEADERGEDPF
jgi:hypothetical protein